MNLFNGNKVYKAAVIAIAYSAGHAIAFPTPEEFASASPQMGGRWLKANEALDALLAYPPSATVTHYDSKNVIKRNIVPGDCKLPKTPPYSFEGCAERFYTTQINDGGVKWPNGIMSVGRASPNGDYVLISAMITKTKYFSKSPPATSATESAYAGCVETEATLSKSSAIAIATSTTVTNSTTTEEVFGRSAKDSHSLEYEIGSSGTAGFNFLNLAKAEVAISHKVGTKNVWEAGTTHDRKQGSSLATAFADGSTYTNTSVLNQKIPAGMVGQSGYWFPYVEVYGVFTFGRLVPGALGKTTYTKVDMTDGKQYYKLATKSGEFHPDKNISNIWMGKIALATNKVTIPGQINATAVQGLLQKPMTPLLYREACAADVAKRNYAPAIKASLCNYNKTVAVLFPDACK